MHGVKAFLKIVWPPMPDVLESKYANDPAMPIWRLCQIQYAIVMRWRSLTFLAAFLCCFVPLHWPYGLLFCLPVLVAMAIAQGHSLAAGLLHEAATIAGENSLRQMREMRTKHDSVS